MPSYEIPIRKPRVQARLQNRRVLPCRNSNRFGKSCARGNSRHAPPADISITRHSIGVTFGPSRIFPTRGTSPLGETRNQRRLSDPFITTSLINSDNLYISGSLPIYYAGLLCRTGTPPRSLGPVIGAEHTRGRRTTAHHMDPKARLACARIRRSRTGFASCAPRYPGKKISSSSPVPGGGAHRCTQQGSDRADFFPVVVRPRASFRLSLRAASPWPLFDPLQQRKHSSHRRLSAMRETA